MNLANSQIRMMTKGVYQLQKLRIQTGNRIVSNFKVKLGQEPGSSEGDLEKEAKIILGKLRKEYTLLTDGVAFFPTSRSFKASGLIDSYTELCLIGQYVELENNEKEQFKRLAKMLELYPIWTRYLEQVDGVGPALASVIISEIDIHKATYPTSLWRLAGLDVGWDNRGRSRRSEHLIEVGYINADGEQKTKKAITFKPFLKTKLMGVLSGSLLKAGNEQFVPLYRDYKNRLENHPEHRDCYIAINVHKSKEVLGYLPKKIYRRRYVTDMYERHQARIVENKPDADPETIVAETKKALRSYLGGKSGHYEIYEVLLEQGLVTEFAYHEDDIVMEVKALKGVLRKAKTMEVFKEVVEDGDETGITTIEVFDEEQDTKGKPLYKLMNIGKTKAHRNQMALRYMVKQFLGDLYNAWRALENLPVMPTFAEAKLNMPHRQAVQDKGQKVA